MPQPWEQADKDFAAALQRMDTRLRKQERLEARLRNGEVYVKHATKHNRGNVDPLRAQTQGGNGFGFGYDYLVDVNWATVVANGLGTEGEQRTLSSGSTFRIYSTVGAAVTRSATDFASSIPGTIFVRPGTYAETITIASSQYVRIIGAGRRSVVIGGLTTSSGSTVSVPATFISGSAGRVWFTGFTLKTNHSASGTASSGLLATNLAEGYFWDLELQGNGTVLPEYPLDFRTGTTAAPVINNCSSISGSYAIKGAVNTKMLVTDSVFTSSTIAISAGEDALIEGCQFTSCTNAITFPNQSSDNLVTGNTFVSGTTCIATSGSSAVDMTISNNEVDSVTTFLDVSSLSVTSGDNWSVHDNHINGGNPNMIKFPSSVLQAHWDVHDNRINDTGGGGTLYTQGGGYPGIKFWDNTIDGSTTSSNVAQREPKDGGHARFFTGNIYWIDDDLPLTIGVTACTIRFGDTDVAVARQTVAMAGSAATNYVEISSAGTLSSNTSAFSTGTYHVLKVVTTAAGTATYSSHTDVGGVLFVNNVAGGATLDAIYLRRDGTTPLTGLWDQSGAFNIVQRGGDLLVANSKSLKLYSDNSATPATAKGTWAASTGALAITNTTGLTDDTSVTGISVAQRANINASSAAVVTGGSFQTTMAGVAGAATNITAPALLGFSLATTISKGTATSINVTEARGLTSTATVATASTLQNMYDFYVADATLGGTGALTTRFAYFSETLSASGTSWGIAVGNNSYINGKLTVNGSSVATEQLDVNGNAALKSDNQLRFYDADNSNYIGMRADSARTTNLVYVLPATDPTVGQVLQASAPSAGVVTLSWVSAPSVAYSIARLVFVPDAAPGAVITSGVQQGPILHSGPSGETATKLCVDAETAPGASGLPITIAYADTDDLDTAASWTTIATVTLSSEKSTNTSSMTNAAIPANRLIRMDVGTIVGSPADANITLFTKVPLSS